MQSGKTTLCMLDKPPEIWFHSRRCARRQGHWKVPHGWPQMPSVLAKYTELDPNSLGEVLKGFKQRKSGVR